VPAGSRCHPQNRRSGKVATLVFSALESLDGDVAGIPARPCADDHVLVIVNGLRGFGMSKVLFHC